MRSSAAAMLASRQEASANNHVLKRTPLSLLPLAGEGAEGG
jgi:hypothetical protein